MKEKLKKISNILQKFTYVYQFIFSLFFAIIIYKLFITKSIYNVWNKWYLLYAILLGIINLEFIIFHIYKYRKKIEKMFLNFAIPIGMLFLVFLIPSQVPDELAHMIKTYEVSKGIMFTKIDENGESKITVPEELLEYNHNKINNYQKLNEQFSKTTDYNKNVDTISSAQGYPAILYFTPALGLLIGRSLGINLVISIYIAKILNFILFLTLGYFTIKKMPFGKIVMTIYLLMPMMLQQAISFSADVLINAISLYYIAYIINLIFEKDNISKKELIIYCILTVLVAISKTVYISLAGIGLLLIFRKNIKKKYKIIFLTLSIILGISAALCTYVGTSMYTSKTEATKIYEEQLNVNGSEQIKQIIENPINFLGVIINDRITNIEQYIFSCIGSKLGWLDIKIDNLIIYLYMLVLLTSCIVEKNKHRFKVLEKIWLLLIVAGTVILTQTAMYIAFTPVGANFIGGVQGRYFVPVFILPLLCICMKDNYIKIKNIEVIMPAIASLLNVLVVITIFTVLK